VDPIWQERIVLVMREVLRAKFSQNQALAQLLLSTGERKLVEHTPKDRFWGDGGDGSGENQLGKLLMELRAALRSHKRKKCE